MDLPESAHSRTREIWDCFISKHAYSTPSPVKRSSFRATLTYHFGFLQVLVNCCSLARRGELNRYTWAACSINVLRAAERAGASVTVSGLENLVMASPFVVVANHMSALETSILPGLILPFSDTTFVVKEALLDYPLLGRVLRAADAIGVTRTSPQQDLKQVLSRGADMLGRGKSVTIFPQSTRTESFSVAKFNSLGVKLARRAGVPVVPVALKTNFLRNGRLIKDFGGVDPCEPVKLEFGKPLIVAGSGKDEHRAIVEFISGRMKEWGVPVEEEPG